MMALNNIPYVSVMTLIIIGCDNKWLLLPLCLTFT